MDSKFNEDKLKKLINSIDEDQGSADEKIRKLRCMRCGLLEDIHTKQQLLDKVDYIICNLRKGDMK